MAEVETKIVETNITEANSLPVVKSNLGGKRPGAGRPVGPRKQNNGRWLKNLQLNINNHL